MKTGSLTEPFEVVWRWVPDGLVQVFPALKDLRAQSAAKRAQVGATAHAAGDLDVAIAEYSKAVGIEPNHHEYLYELGRSFYEKGQLTEAEDYFRRTLNLKFSDAQAVKGLGYTLHRLGKIDEAIYCYLRYLDAKPDDAAVHANLIAALEAEGKYEEAVAAGDRAVARFPSNGPLLFMLGRNNYFAGRIDLAISQLGKTIELDPTNGDVFRVLGIALKTKGDLNGALKNFQETLKHNPSDADAYLAVAEIYQGLGRKTEYLDAARQARRLFELQKNDFALKYACWEEGWALYKLGRWKESVEASKCALNVDPTLSPVRFNLGLALLRLGEPDHAREEYRKSLETADAASLKLDAIDDLNDAIRAQPDLPGAAEILQELEAKYHQSAAEQERKLAARASARSKVDAT